VKNSIDIFNIIKTLTSSEKRAITTSSRKSGEEEPDHIKLLRALDKMEVYDVEKLKKLLRGEAFISHLPVIKNYLYQIVTKNLRDAFTESSLDTRMLSELLDIEIFYQKGLYQLANKRLQKISKEAEQKEKFEILQLCYQLERKLAPYTGNVYDPNAIMKRDAILLKRIDELGRYRTLSYTLSLFFIERGEGRTNADERWLNDFLANPLLSKRAIKNTLSFSAAILYYRLRAFGYSTKHNYRQAIIDTDGALSIYEKFVPADMSLFIPYTDIYCNKVLYLTKDKRYNDAISSIRKIKEIPNEAISKKWKYKLPDHMRLNLLYKCTEREMTVYSNSAKFDRVTELAFEMRKLHDNKELKMHKSSFLVSNYNLAYEFFIVGNYRETIYHLNIILNYTKEDTLIREDVYCMSKLLLLITHYELKSEDILGYLLRSTYRFLAQRNRKYRTEDAILSFIKNKLLRNIKPGLLYNDFKELMLTIEKITKKAHERNILEFFDWTLWLESKITRKKFVDIIKQKRTTE
jgi:hypothetical protein